MRRNIIYYHYIQLNLAVDNILTQWVRGNTRYRGNEEPSRLDSVFTLTTRNTRKSRIQESNWEGLSCITRIQAKGRAGMKIIKTELQ